MENYKDGTASFDRITVLGKDFVSGCRKDDMAVYNYAFDVKPYLISVGKKKNAPENYGYRWEGFFNMMINGTRIRFHPVLKDHGLVEMEQKLELLKEKMLFFVKELRARRKVNAKSGDKVRYDKTWLNKTDTPFTGYISSTIYEDGGGQLAIADCHKTIHWFPEGWLDNKGNQNFDETYTLTLKSIEEFARGLGKACKAIQELRKFFTRELDSHQG